MPRKLRLVAPAVVALLGLAAVVLIALRLVAGPQIPQAPPRPEPTPRAELAVSEARPAEEWPALFGTAEASKPAVVPAGPAQPEGTYTLRGIVTSGDTGWAIIADGGREILVRPGDEVEAGWIVDTIAADRVIIAHGADEAVVAFPAGERVRTVEVAEQTEPDGEVRPAQEVRTPVASPSQVRDMILRAEAERVARGLAAPPRPAR